jgi:ribokinase
MPSLVTVVGSMNIDTVVAVEVHPQPGETVLGRDRADRPGGKGANQAAAAAATGASTTLIAMIGADAPGRAYRAALAERGIDVNGVTESTTSPSGAAFIAVNPAGENSIIVMSGSNLDLDPQHVRDALSSDAQVVITQLESPPEAVEAALRRARELGVVSILNASPVIPEAAELAALADIVIVNEHEAAQLGLTDACVTLGARGATWEGETVAPPKVQVVDTTGAGDVFAGTLAGQLALSADHSTALRAAVEASARATTTAGAQPWQLTV